MYEKEFKAEIAKNIARTIRALRREGTVAMGLANLLMVTPTPFGSRFGGTNAAYIYKQMFAEVVAGNPAFKKFTDTGRYDYEKQAWVDAEGRYLSCAHPREMACSCYGRKHEGEVAR